MLHGLCFGEEAGARNLVFFRVKWPIYIIIKGDFEHDLQIAARAAATASALEPISIHPQHLVIKAGIGRDILETTLCITAKTKIQHEADGEHLA